MKVLVFGRKDSIFVKELIDELTNRFNIEFELIDIFHFEHIKNITKSTNRISNLPTWLLKYTFVRYLLSIPCTYLYLLKLKNEYDICHLMYKKFQYYFVIKQIAKKCSKIKLTIFGSDFYKNKLRFIDKNFYHSIDQISFANCQTKDDFNKYYNNLFNKKTIICPFGLKNLEYIDKIKKIESKIESKNKLGVSKELVICCGSNGSSNEQHENIIDQLSKLKSKKNEKMIFVFPITYACSKSKINKIKDLIQSKIPSLNTIVFDKFLSSDDIARLRLISDIFINVRKTDQLCGGMIESLYTKNIVITGSWLPYQTFKKESLFFIEIKKTIDLCSKLQKIIDNWKNFKKKVINNSNCIKNLYHWENRSKQWYSFYCN